MSATPRTGGGAGGALVLLVAALAVGGAALLVLSRPVPLDSSAIGFDGLAPWLARDGVSVETVLPAPDDPRHAASFRVLPLFDNDVTKPLGGRDGSDDGGRGSIAPREMTEAAFERKVGEVASLVVLPKWRAGVAARGRVHPEFLIPPLKIWLFDEKPTVKRPAGPPFRSLPVRDARDGTSPGSVTLYRPQFLGPEQATRCEPIWTVEGVGTLLAYCDEYTPEDNAFFLLSDPDLLDNHGLALGENAALARELIRAIAPGKTIFVDGGDDRADAHAGDDPHARGLSDLERFVRYPFSLAWIGVGLATSLALWRGGVRFGEPRPDRGVTGLQSKRDTITAAGRLMRLAGHEDVLIRTYAHARLDALADELVGRRGRRGGGADAVIGLLRLRAPALGARLERAVADVADTEGAGRGDRSARATLPVFDAAIREVWDEFGRPTVPPRRDHR